MATDIIARGMITEYIAGTNINFTENRDGTVEISASGSISSEDSVARDAIGNHKSDTSNPHNVTPAQIGLGNVDNTSDLDKPISTAVKQAIDNKADKTVATTSADGLMSAEDKGKLDNADNTYALKSKYGDTTIDVGRQNGSITGDCSVAVGKNSVASGYASHAEGSNTKTWIGATSTLSDRTVVIDDNTTVIVSGTQAYGRNSHAEGCQSLSYGENSHAEGTSSAIGWGSHSEGGLTKAEGEYSHAEGRDTLASGRDSHAGGTGTKALHTSEVAYGRYNLSNSDTLFSIGDGTSDTNRHNAFEITTTGGKLHDKDIATTDLIPTELPANGGNADTLGGYSEDYFAKSDNPSIEGNINLLRSGNATTAGSIFAWEETVRIRNEDPNAENTTYTDLIVTPDGIYTESTTNGVIKGRTKIESGKPYITGSATVAANSSVCVSNHGFTPCAVVWWDGSLSGVAVSFSDTQFVMDKTSSVDRMVNYLIFK